MNYILKIKLSNLAFADSISRGDLFVVSHWKNNEYKSKKIEFSGIGTYFCNELFSLSSFNPVGTFDFLSATNIGIEDEGMKSLSSVANVNEANKLMHLLEILSALIYGDPLNPTEDRDDFYYPTHVGQVIISNESLTNENLHQIYGKHTEWENYGQGRLLVTAGKAGSNTNNNFGTTKSSVNFTNKSMGGESFVELKTIPSHTHVFADMPRDKFPGIEDWAFNLHAEPQVFPLIIKVDDDIGRKHTGGWHGNYLPADAKLSVLEVPDVDYTKEFKFKVEGEIEDYGEGEPHYNIPPYVTKYIYRRIK